jgi:hypothetical protein
MQCHCLDAQENHEASLMTYTVTGLDGQAYQICNQYVWDQYISLAYSNAVSYMIIGINYVLRLFIIKLIVYIGKDTESEQTRLITNGVFITNSSILVFFSWPAMLTSKSKVLSQASSSARTLLTSINHGSRISVTPLWLP